MTANKTWLLSFGLEKVITGQDDPELWEAALHRYWQSPDDPSILVDSLRFGTGRRLAEEEQACGESNGLTSSQRALVDVEDWHFERTGDGQFIAMSYEGVAPVPPVILPGMSFIAGIHGFTGQPVQGPVVFQYLSISRPSAEVDEAVVYSATSAPGVGDGVSYLWKKKDNGLWEQTDTCLSRWVT
jgi:hypothetical protein